MTAALVVDWVTADAGSSFAGALAAASQAADARPPLILSPEAAFAGQIGLP